MRKFIAVLVLILGVGVASAQQVYNLLPSSEISVKGTSTLHDWEVKSSEFEGRLELKSKRKAVNSGSASGEIIAGSLKIKVEGLKGERGETMNAKMHRALKFEEHPTIDFQLSTAFYTHEETSIEGQLTIGGTSKTLTFPAALLVNDGEINISTEKSIKMSDFGIEPPTAMFGQIVTGDEVTIDLKLAFKLADQLK